jgi:predicted transcriptional regulator
MGVNDRIRKEIKKALIDSGRSQKDVAAEMGIKPQYLSEMLNTDKSGVPKRWEQLLEVVGLELYVRERSSK